MHVLAGMFSEEILTVRLDCTARMLYQTMDFFVAKQSPDLQVDLENKNRTSSLENRNFSVQNVKNLFVESD